ncbi:hypothetical protein SSX86_017589 [Deinandra increscens subsp. villosa]|uniref:RING-type E3 ubiquitin transferase n=1 Tax=Deinandra increscens subsp. villosa TaxID=3103831 RepID=A0AAP0GX73_9ASTR
MELKKRGVTNVFLKSTHEKECENDFNKKEDVETDNPIKVGQWYDVPSIPKSKTETENDSVEIIEASHHFKTSDFNGVTNVFLKSTDEKECENDFKKKEDVKTDNPIKVGQWYDVPSILKSKAETENDSVEIIEASHHFSPYKSHIAREISDELRANERDDKRLKNLMNWNWDDTIDLCSSESDRDITDLTLSRENELSDTTDSLENYKSEAPDVIIKANHQRKQNRGEDKRTHSPTPFYLSISTTSFSNSHRQITESMDDRRKKLFGFLPDFGCRRVSSSAVTVNPPAEKQRRRRKKKKGKQRRNRGSCPENVCCTPPVVGFTYDVAQSTSSRNHRQRSRGSRQATDRQRSLNLNAERIEDASLVRSNVSDSRQYNRLPRRSPGGISEIVMVEHNPLLDGGIEGSDRFGAWRINADIMSYEELVELSDRIGYVDGGLQEEEILECLKRPKKSFIKSVDFNSQVKDSKCSICQEECKGDEDLGRLECGHYHHLNCIKQWLLRKNECPICKTVAKPDK